MQIKNKSWVWKLTWPFAHNNVTSFGDTIYRPQGMQLSQKLIAHEEIHLDQQAKVGKWKYLFLYLFAFPFVKNKWRYQWELEAYIEGSKISEEEAKKKLASKAYGWIS